MKWLWALGLLVIGALFSSGASAASFDCARARTPVENLVCTDPELSRADDEMAGAYREARQLLDTYDANNLVREQRQWLRYGLPECGFTGEKNVRKVEPRDCLRAEYQAWMGRLKYWSELGRIIVVDPTDAQACSLLERQNVLIETWDGLDNYELRLPDEFVEADITAAGNRGYVEMDFLNSGKPTRVYSISALTSHYEYQWFVVVAPGEEEAISRLMAGFYPDEAIAEQLTRHPVGQAGYFPTANESATAAKRAPVYKSMLFDTSNTTSYGGWYTRPHVLMLRGVTYVAATSLNNLGGPSVALFRPEPSGDLKLLCYHRALPMRVHVDIERRTPGVPCPEGVLEREILWRKDKDTGNKTAIIDLPEWGGRRPVRQESAGISVGAVGAPTVDENVWPDINYFGASLLLTDMGPYLRIEVPYERSDPNDPISQVSFDRISDNTLRPACAGTARYERPPGYAQR